MEVKCDDFHRPDLAKLRAGSIDCVCGRLCRNASPRPRQPEPEVLPDLATWEGEGGKPHPAGH